MVTFSTRDSPDELERKLKIRKPRWKNFDLEDNLVISDDDKDKDTRLSYVCDVCKTALQYNGIDKSYWCNTCVRYIEPKDVKKVVDFEIPQSVQDITPAAVCIDSPGFDDVSVKKKVREGLKITSYHDEDNPA
jgi:hypothetical protein